MADNVHVKQTAKMTNSTPSRKVQSEIQDGVYKVEHTVCMWVEQSPVLEITDVDHDSEAPP